MRNESAENDSKGAGGGEPPFAPLHLLLVEDDRLGAIHAGRMIEKAGHTFATAADGQEAISLLNAQRFDAGLLDIELPDMNGFDLARAVRAGRTHAPADLPLYALTGHSADAIRDDAAAAGFNGILAKPLEPRVLSASLRSPGTEEPFFTAADAELAGEFAAIFLEEMPRQLDELDRARERGDLTVMARTAHSLKSTTAMLDAHRASKAAQNLERAAADGRVAQCGELFEILKKELNTVQKQLTSLTNSNGNI